MCMKFQKSAITTFMYMIHIWEYYDYLLQGMKSDITLRALSIINLGNVKLNFLHYTTDI